MIRVIATGFAELNYEKKHEDKVNAVLEGQKNAKLETYVVQNISKGDSKYVHHGQIITVITLDTVS